MKAFEAAYPVGELRSDCDCDLPYCLPRVNCTVCGEEACSVGAWYPSVGLKPGADPSRFTLDPAVTLKEFLELRKQLVVRAGSKLKLPPGSSFGMVTGRLPKNPCDFVWCGFELCARRRVLNDLARDGIRVPFGPAKLTLGRKPTDEFVAIELDPSPLYSDRTLKEMTLVQCKVCGEFSMQDVRAKPKGPREFVLSRMPKGRGLVRIDPGLYILATEQFMAAYQRRGFTGLEFEEVGVYV